MKSKIFVGITGNTREIFRSSATPTRETHGEKYAAVIGPFRTKRGAEFMRDHGRNNPHCQAVADAERLAESEYNSIPGIRAIYDNGGATLDRYTVYYTERERDGRYTCYAMSERPFHPLGFGQHGSGQLGRHNGRRIRFSDLPADCQMAVRQDSE